jgi:hypothetical protein
VPTPVPTPVAADSTGLPDSRWITTARDYLADYPRKLTETWTADGTNGVFGSVSSAPVSVLYPPVNGTAADSNPPLVRDNTTATNYTVIDSGTPTGTQVLFNYNTGEFQFATAPALNDVIQVSYQSCRWTDTSILAALYDGLRAMFPRVGKTYSDTSVQIQVNQWDYTLPTWFADPRSRINAIEIADPYIPTEPFRPAPAGWDRVGLTTLHLPWSQNYSPVARLRIQGWGPYLTLGDLEPQLYDLPLWYALGALLPHREAKRIREDTMAPLAQAGGVQPGIQLQTGDYFQRRFEAALVALSRVPGPSSRIPLVTVFQRRRY